jgi:hypothetical protein
MGPPSLARAVSRQRPVHDQPAEICLHSDASDLGYGGTIGSCQEAGSPGQLDLQGLWETEDCKDSKSVRELRAVRLLGARHFAAQLKDPQIRKVLLWEDNQAVVAAINKLTSSSPVMVSELRRLQNVLERFGVQIAARWLPSAVNKYADRLSRTWNVRDVGRKQSGHGDEEGFWDMAGSANVSSAASGISSRGGTHASVDSAAGAMGDGMRRLWTPPPELVPLV